MAHFTQADFDDDDIAVLGYLTDRRSVREDRACRYEAMKRDLGDKVEDLDAVLKRLLNKGAIGRTKKGTAGKNNYWVSLDVLGVLKEQGRWSMGRIHRL